MLNDLYFREDEIITISFGNKKFKEECVDYLATEYNYTFADLMSSTSITDEVLNELYCEDFSAKEFIDNVMEESGFNKGNYFNIFLSGGRNIE